MGSSFRIQNVYAFDGTKFKVQDISVDNGRISLLSPPGQTVKGDGQGVVDGTGKYLIPGLIDCHVHMQEADELYKLARHGVTTALDMGNWNETVKASIRTKTEQEYLPTVKNAGAPATCPGSTYSRFPGIEPYLISSPSEADAWVAQRIEEGADYIKVISDAPVGPSQELLNGIVTSAHKRGKLVVAHAARNEAVKMSVRADTDVLTHVPLDFANDSQVARDMKTSGLICVPTLAMCKALAAKGVSPGMDYGASKTSLQVLHREGVLVLAGTDANAGAMCPVEHGASIHHELGLLVEAGMTPLEALRSATVLVPSGFPNIGLEDVGSIRVGARADLVMLSGDPLESVRNTERIERVWIRGRVYNDSEQPS